MKKILFSFLCSTIMVVTFAQNNVSPYSIIGIGDIEHNSFDRSTGMGGAGISLASPRYLYNANPASYSKLDDHFISMEVTMRYKGVTYYGNGVNQTNNVSSDLSVEKLALAIKLKRNWGVSAGLLPYSSSNYSFTGSKNIIGTTTNTSTYYEGTGGLHQAYLANAISLSKNIRVGVQTTALFGQFNQKETMYLNALNITSNAVVSTNKMYINSFYGKAGIQYEGKLNKHWQLNLGAIALLQTKLNAEQTIVVEQDSGTLYSSSNIKDNYFTLPLTYGGGISLVHNNSLTISADYVQQQWSNIQYKGLNYQLVNSNRIAAGIEYAKKINYANTVYEPYFLQAGMHYTNSYLKINNQQLNEYGITVGAGFNAKRSQLGYLFNMEFGSKGTTQNNLIKENYMKASFTILCREFWFTKIKKYN
jgi:hypothetical protein